MKQFYQRNNQQATTLANYLTKKMFLQVIKKIECMHAPLGKKIHNITLKVHHDTGLIFHLLPSSKEIFNHLPHLDCGN